MTSLLPGFGLPDGVMATEGELWRRGSLGEEVVAVRKVDVPPACVISAIAADEIFGLPTVTGVLTPRTLLDDTMPAPAMWPPLPKDAAAWGVLPGAWDILGDIDMA